MPNEFRESSPSRSKSRRRRLLRRISIGLGVLSLALATVLFLLTTSLGEERLRRFVESRTDAALGGTTTLQHLDIQLFRAAVAFDGLRLAPDPDRLPMILQVERAEVALRQGGLAASIDGLDLSLGPFPPSKEESAEPIDFNVAELLGRLRLRRAKVDGGRVQILDSAGLLLDLDGITAVVEGVEEFTADVTVETLHLDAGGVLEAGAVTAKGRLDRDGIHVREARLATGNTLLQAAGSLAARDPSVGTFTLEADADAALARIWAGDLPIAGRLVAEGELELAGGEALDLRARGTLTDGHYAELGPLEADLSTEVSLERTEWRAGGSIYDGEAEVSGWVEYGSDSPLLELEVKLEGLDPAPLLEDLGAPSLAFGSRVSGPLRLTLARDLRGEAELVLVPVPGSRVPLRGRLRAVLEKEELQVEVEGMRAPGLLLDAEARLFDDRLQGRFDLRVADAGAALSSLENAGLLEPLPIEIAGSASLAGTLGGTIEEPQLGAELLSERIEIDDYPVGLSTELEADRRRLSLNRIRARLLSEVPPEADADVGFAELGGAARFDLQQGTFTATVERFAARLEDLLPAEAGLELTGSVTGEGSLEGTFAEPDGALELELSDLVLRGEELATLRLVARAEGGEVAIAGSLPDRELLRAVLGLQPPYPLSAELELAALPWSTITRLIPRWPEKRWLALVATGRLEGELDLERPEELRYLADVESGRLETVEGTILFDPFLAEGDLATATIHNLRVRRDTAFFSLDGRLPLQEGETFDLRADADAELGFLAALLPRLEIEGTAVLDVQVRGTAANPDVEGFVQIRSASGKLSGIEWQDLELDAELQEDHIEIRRGGARLLDGSVELEGRLPLAADATGKHPKSRLEFELQDLDLALLLPEEVADRRAAARIRLSGWLESPIRELGELRGAGSLEIPSLGGPRQRMASRQAAGWRLEQSRLVLESLELVGEGGELFLDGAANLTGSPHIEGSMRGVLPLAIVNVFLGPEAPLSLAGLVEPDVTVRYANEEPTWSGTIALEDGRLVLRQPQIDLTNASGTLRFEGQRIVLDRFRGQLADGEAVLEGYVEFPGLARLGGADLRAELTEAGVQFAPGIQGVVKGGLSLQGEERYQLSGSLEVRRGLFSREIDAASAEGDFLSQVRTDLLAEDVETLADRIDLEVRLSTPGDFLVLNELAQLEIGGNVVLRGTAAEPQLFGALSTQPQGTVVLGRNLYTVERASVRLSGPVDDPPEVDFEASTEVSNTIVQIRASGPIDAIDIQLSADDPKLTQADIASLVVTGRRMDAASEGMREIVTAEAATYLSDVLAEQVGVDLGLVFGTVADFPFLSTEIDPESQFTVGKRLTDQLMVSYSQSLDRNDRQYWILDYSPYRNLWLRYVQEAGSANTLEVATRRQFDYRHRGAEDPLRAARKDTRPRIEAIGIEGDPPLDVDLERALRLRSGSRYDYWLAREAAERMRRSLAAAGYMNARVDVVSELHSNGRSVDLRFAVEKGPKVEVVWSGDDPGKHVRAMVEDGWDGRILEEFLLIELRHLATDELRRQRYFVAEVKVSVEELDELHRVTFDVDLGPRGKGVEVRFENNEVLDDETLRTTLPPTDSRTFFALFERKLDRLRDRIALEYANIGHLDLEVGEVTAAFDEGSGILHITVPVVEGPVFRIGTIRFEGLSELDRDTVLAASGLVENEPFSLHTYTQARTALNTLYRDAGFWRTRTRSRVSASEERLDVTFEIEEGYRARTGRIEIVGYQTTNEARIRRQITVQEGDLLGMKDLLETQRRISDLGLFRVVSVDSTESETPGVRDILVEVREMPDLILDLGIRYRNKETENLQPGIGTANTSGVEPAIRAKFSQPFGGGGNMILALFPRFDGYVARVSHQRNTLAGVRVPTEIYAEARREVVEEIDEQISQWNLTFQQHKDLRDRLRAQWSYQYGQGRIDERGDGRDSPFPTGERIARGRITGSLIGENRDNPIAPKDGMFWNATLQVGSEVLGSDIDYVRLYGAFSYLLPFAGAEERPWVWASGVRLGNTLTDDIFPFLSDRFTAGGAYSVRGFPNRSLGPIYPPTGEPLGGEALAIFNQELRFPIWGIVRGGLFFDAGNVFAQAEDFDLGELRTSAGLGLRVVLPFGVFRGDYGFILDRREGEPTGRFHFAFGHAF